jgi:hypothetical protein
MGFWAELRRRDVVRVAAAYRDFRRPLGTDDVACA